MLYLAWDIDGTLLLTNRAGYDALQEATQEYFHLKEPYQFKHSLAGCTDSAIIKEIVTEIKGRCTSGWAAGLMLTYEMKMKRTLKTHKGYLMPNVAKTLEYIKENVPDITNLLMTGNTTGGARDKVTHYGIVSHFDFRHSSYGDLVLSPAGRRFSAVFRSAYFYRRYAKRRKMCFCDRRTLHCRLSGQ